GGLRGETWDLAHSAPGAIIAPPAHALFWALIALNRMPTVLSTPSRAEGRPLLADRVPVPGRRLAPCAEPPSPQSPATAHPERSPVRVHTGRARVYPVAS